MHTTMKRLATATLAAALCATAQASDTLQDLRSNISAGNTTSAWQQAQQMRKQWESDSEFDYLYGVLALEQKQYNEAQFALERVVQHDPSHVQARLALAKAYYQLGDKSSARRQLDAVKQSDPPAHVMRDVNHYLTAINGSHSGSFNGYVEAALGHDSNINGATGSSTIPNPDFDPLDLLSDPTLTLNSAVRQQSDMYDTLQAGVSYYQPLSGDTGMELSGRVSSRDNFSSDRYDSNSYRGSASLITLVGKDQLRGTFTVMEHRISGSDYQDYYSLSGDWTRYLDGGWALFGAMYLNELRYDDHLKDIDQYIASIGVQRQTGALLQGAGITLGDENAHSDDGNHNARLFGGFYYDARYRLGQGHQVFGKLYWQQSHQNEQDPFFNEVREDQLQQLSAGWDWQLSKPLRLRTELVYQHNDSDIDYFSHERTRLQTGMRYSF